MVFGRCRLDVAVLDAGQSTYRRLTMTDYRTVLRSALWTDYLRCATLRNDPLFQSFEAIPNADQGSCSLDVAGPSGAVHKASNFPRGTG